MLDESHVNDGLPLVCLWLSGWLTLQTIHFKCATNKTVFTIFLFAYLSIYIFLFFCARGLFLQSCLLFRFFSIVGQIGLILYLFSPFVYVMSVHNIQTIMADARIALFFFHCCCSVHQSFCHCIYYYSYCCCSLNHYTCPTRTYYTFFPPSSSLSFSRSPFLCVCSSSRRFAFIIAFVIL